MSLLISSVSRVSRSASTIRMTTSLFIGFLLLVGVLILLWQPLPTQTVPADRTSVHANIPHLLTMVQQNSNRVKTRSSSSVPNHTPALFPYQQATNAASFDNGGWTSPDAQATRSMAWGDMDGDGDLDLAVGNHNQANQVYENLGDGSFALLVGFSPAGQASRSVAWGDMDGDGDLDLAVGNYDNQANQVYENLGGGSFALLASFPSDGQNTASIAWGDINGDGDLDLAVGNYNQANQVYENLGSGSFALLAGFTPAAQSTWSVAWGDINGDGDLDLAVGNYNQANQVYENLGSNSFALLVGFPADAQNTRTVAWGDIDGDGDLDLAVGNSNQANQVYENLGGSSFALLGGFPADAQYTRSIALGDMDGDGDLDLAVGNDNNQVNQVYENLGDGSFTLVAGFPTAAQNTESVAWGDMDGDGDLDLAVGNYGQSNQVNEILGSGSFALLTGFPAATQNTESVAWGDMDGDGDLDLAVGNYDEANQVYENLGGGSFAPLGGFPTDVQYTRSVAWGDMDGDGDLDLAVGNDNEGNLVQVNQVYENLGGGAFNLLTGFTPEAKYTRSIAWGDMDGDGDLDLAVGNHNQANQVYENMGNGSFNLLASFPAVAQNTRSVAWGDMDGDGDLDLAIGNENNQANLVYENLGSGSFTLLSGFPTAAQNTRSVAWGDFDGDGDLDLAVGNHNQSNQMYENLGGSTFVLLASFIPAAQNTRNVIWGDMDGDGDLDLAVSNYNQGNQVYENLGGGSFTLLDGFAPTAQNTVSIAWGDMDEDGDLDIIVGNYSQANQVYENLGRAGVDTTPVPYIYPSVSQPIDLPAANFYAQANYLDQQHIPISYTLFSPNGLALGGVRLYYSLNGGGQWRPAIATTDTLQTNLATSPWPTATITNTHVYTWDTFASGFFGQSDNVVLRLVTQSQPHTNLSADTFSYPNQAAGPIQFGAVAATTFPFRVRGAQIRVISATEPISQAIVYRLPAGQNSGGHPFADNASLPYYTQADGYLQGRGQINVGDTLFALAPIQENISSTYTIYATNIQPNATSLSGTIFTEPGVQTITVSANNPLLLFNLNVSLEWDAQKDPFYLTKLETDLRKSSELLFDWSNGQVALGKITIYQAKENWYFSDIVVHASNQYRPNATIGGITTEYISETLKSGTIIEQAYQAGQIHMGANWNRFGAASGGQVDDWATALAHEIGHYGLFLQDNYFGVDDAQFKGVDCFGSAMTNPYISSYSEFLTDTGWQGDCQKTMAERTLGLPDWGIIQRHYPLLSDLGGESQTGPIYLPLELLEVNYITPTISTSLPDQIIELTGLADLSTQARGYLFKNQNTTTLTDDTVVDLGRPMANGLLVRGLTTGDRICVLDFAKEAVRSGCVNEASNSTQSILMQAIHDWEPQVQVNTINTTTLQVSVTVDIAAAQMIPNLQLQVLPAATLNGVGTAYAPAITMSERQTTTQAVIFSQLISLPEPIFNGFVRVWEPQAPVNKEILTEFRLSGDWPVPRASGGGIVPRASGGGMAPVLSGDGQALILSTDPVALFSRDFKASLQTVHILPALPAWLTPVGNGYRFTLAKGETNSDAYSIIMQYLQANVASALEPHLNIYYQAENSGEWQLLPAFRDSQDNLISADIPNNEVQGQGIYVLVAAVHAPALTIGWNELVFPLPGSQPVDHAFASIAHAMTSVYGYDLNTFSWQLYDQTVLTEHPEFALLVNNLTSVQFGQSYWIHATESVQPIIPVHGPQSSLPIINSSGGFLPATFYGWVTPSATFNPVVGDVVKAWINGNLCGNTTVTDEVNGQLAYVMQVFADVGNGCGVLGRDITLVVAGQTMPNQSTWSNKQACFFPLGDPNVTNTDCFTNYGHQVYLPMISSGNSPNVVAPDLIVSNISVDSGGIEVTLLNQGTAPVPTGMEFWVDLYINPVRTPTANDIWQMVANEGAVWGVTSNALPLAPGQSVILTLHDGYYVDGLSNYSGLPAANTPIFVQVDSAHAGTTYGAVLESHEIVGSVYNNIEVVVYKPQ